MGEGIQKIIGRHIWKPTNANGRGQHTTRRIPTISYVAVPKISDTRSSLCAVKEFMGTNDDEANKAIEGGSNLVAFGDKA